MTAAGWRRYELRIGMPHMVPGRLSEVELLKWMGAFQWDTIAAALGKPSHEIVGEDGDRLYASFIDIELEAGNAPGLDRFGEGDTLYLHNRIGFHARRFVEGLFVIGKEPELPADLAEIDDRAQLRGRGLCWGAMTNAFVARGESNSRLRLFQPAGIAQLDVPTGGRAAETLSLHASVQETGVIPVEIRGMALTGRDDDLLYEIVPENDLNGAGLLYFARYPAIMNIGERLFLTRSLRPGLSSELVSCLSTARRRLFYYANADAHDQIQLSVGCRMETTAEVPPRLFCRIDLQRRSDGRLLACAHVEKELRVPARSKVLRAEVGRFLRRESAR